MILVRALVVGLLILSTLACGREDGAKSGTDGSNSAAVSPMPDVGKLQVVSVKTTGSGSSASEAVTEAMVLALMEVNGAVLEMNTIRAKFGLKIEMNQDTATIRSSAFAETISQRSGGVITGLKVIDIVEPKRPEERYKVSIEAKISKFMAPADGGRIKIVVAPVRFAGQSFTVGDETVSGPKLSQALQRRIVDALNETGRFSVLDREVSAEVHGELDLIAAGQSPSAEFAKLGQALSADVVWIGRVNGLEYKRESRKLLNGQRELVSYSGGWAFSHRIVNVATRQLLMSDTMRGNAPAIAATTLGVAIDSNGVLQDMESEITSRAVESILARTFPISIVSREGNSVVLSQGGQSIKENTRYSAVLLGEQLKDPQTGQSLGRMEIPCCEVVIDKVGQNLSYGHLEGVSISLEKAQPGGLQLRGQLKSVSNQPKQKVSESSSRSTEASGGKSRGQGASEVREETADISKAAREEKW